MSAFFNSFPKVDYKVGGTSTLYQYSENVTNLFFRIGVIKEVLNNTSSYYSLEIEDGDTPEILADKIYKDVNAGWIILYSNKIFDPQFDWPLTYRQFNRYIENKYGSIAAAKTSIHHYEKVIERQQTDTGFTTTVILPLSYERLTVNRPDAPFDFYTPFLERKGTTVDATIIKADSTQYTVDDEDVIDEGLPTVKSVETFNINGKTIVETQYSRYISNYDYEEKLNDNRRNIKVIKSEYYGKIMEQFEQLTGVNEPYRRRLPTA